MTSNRRNGRTSRLAIAASVPLDASLSKETMVEIAHAFIGMTGIEPDELGEALPCRLDHRVELDETDMPTPGAPQMRLRGRSLRIVGVLTDFDRPFGWQDGDAEWCAGTSVMSEAFAMLSAATDAAPGDLLGAMGRVGNANLSGPIAMTAQGIRWIPIGAKPSGHHERRTIWSVRSIPPSLIGELEGGEPTSHASLDRMGLRRHLSFDTMKRAVPGTRATSRIGSS